MEAIAPTRFAAPWDNVGLLIGDRGASLERVLLTIDCTPDVIDEARRERYDALVSYHPPIFEAQKRFLAGSLAYDLAQSGVAAYSPHTALDVADGGTNDVLADALGMTERRPLRVVEPPWGFGRVGAVPRARGIGVVANLKQALGLAHVLVAGSLEREMTRAAVCAGSGGDLLDDVLAAGAELLVTGELRHHDVLRATAAGLTVVCTLHSASERCALIALQRRLAARLPGVVVACSEADREPLSVA